MSALTGGDLPGEAPAAEPAAEAAPDAETQVAEKTEAAPELSNDWRAVLPDDLKGDPSLEKYSSVEDLAKGYVHASKAIGADKAVVPGKHASDADWKRYLGKAGLPDKIEGYEIKTPEGATFEDGFQSKFKQFAYEKNLFPHQANEVLNFVHSAQKEAAEKAATERENTFKESLNALKQEYGVELNPNLRLAQSVVKEFGGEIEGFMDFLDSSGFGDDPRLIKFLVKVGSSLKDDVITGIEESNGLAPEAAKQEHAKMMADPDGPLMNQNHPNHAAAVKEASKLMQMAFPE